MSLISSLFMKAFAYFVGRNDEARDRGLTAPSELAIFRDLRYAPGGEEHLLDVYTPAGEGESLPVLVSVHGGGFCYGDKERYRFYCMHLALQGYTVFNFNYRLLPARFPAPLEDLNDVMRFIAAHAREYRADPQNIFAVGDSVGALVLSAYAGLSADPAYAGKYAFSAPLRFCAIALHSGVFDCGGGFGGLSGRAVREWTKGRAGARELLAASRYVGAGYPPVFLTYSVNDSIAAAVPDLAALLAARGVRHELRVYGKEDEGVGHVFQLDIRSAAALDCNRQQHAFFSAFRQDT